MTIAPPCRTIADCIAPAGVDFPRALLGFLLLWWPTLAGLAAIIVGVMIAVPRIIKNWERDGRSRYEHALRDAWTAGGWPEMESTAARLGEAYGIDWLEFAHYLRHTELGAHRGS